MADAYIGEIRMVGFPYAPQFWTNADGQMLSINEHTALFSLYGTLYGGDGRSTFGLPDMRGRVPIHTGRGPGLPDYEIGWKGGAPSVVLAATQAPVHTHPATVRAHAANGDQESPTDHYWAQPGSRTKGYSASHDATLSADAVEVGENTGGGQAHENMQPYLTIRFCVCLDGTYPPRQ